MSAATTLRAAAARVDLQPIVGSRLTGFASRLAPSTGCHDPLMARLLLLDDGATRLAWIVCDLIGFSTVDDARLRELVAGRLGVPAHHVLVSCTHTHSGPSSMPFRGTLAQVDTTWLDRTFRAITDTAAALSTELRPAMLLHATRTVGGLAYNRQDDQSPIDERLLVAQLRAEDDEVIATVLNYATHPVVLGELNLLFSGDYPGYACRIVEDAVGGVGLFVLGSAGDVDPVVYRDVGRHAGTFAVAEAMGRALASAAIDGVRSAAPIADAALSVVTRRLEVPLAPPPSLEELQRLKQQIVDRGKTGRGPSEWSTFELAWAEDLLRAMERNAVPRFVEAPIVAARVGEVYVMTFPFEIYSQIGLDMRRRFAPRQVMIAGYTNGLIGYAPTDRAIDQGGYGPALSYRFFPQLLTRMGRGADAALVSAARELLTALG